MTLTIDNNLLSINICFGSTPNHSEIIFASHIDSCTAINVVNIKIHQWVITKHLEIVSCYIQYEKENPFDPIQLNCVVEDSDDMKDTYGKLTALVDYNTNYFHPNCTTRTQIELGLGK